MNLNEAIQVWRGYDSSQGLDDLLKCRQVISLGMWELAGEIAELELSSKEAHAERKVQLAVCELESGKSTVAERKSEAVRMTGDQAKREAQLEGKLKALRIKYDALGEMSNAISSFLKNG